MTTHHRLLSLTLLVAAGTGACGEPRPSFDPVFVEASAIDWRLLVEGPSERRTRERDQRLGAGPVRIAGYMIPLEEFPLDQSLVRLTEFLLVPYAGACIHYPPPPPDQMIHVRMAPGQAVPLDLWTWDPLEIAGVLRAEPIESEFGAVGYRMDGLGSREYGSGLEEFDAVQGHLGSEGAF